LCLFVVVCRIVMAVSRAHSFRQFSWFLSWYN